MSKKIFKASFLTTIIVLAAAMTVIMGILFNISEHQLQSELKNEAEYLSHAVENEGTDFFSGFESNGKRITLINPEGTVIYDNEADPSALDNHAQRKEIADAAEKGSGMSIRYSKTLTEKTVYYAVKLADNKILRISTTRYTVFTLLMGMAQPILVVLVAALLLTLFLSFRVSKSIIRPINEIDPEHPEKAAAYPELKPLLKKIAVQNQILGEREAFRREFTANVSHELKTPLTSISGFAELMKDGDTPAEVVADFSKSIYDEAQRLITLVNDIIKISELDEKNIHYEPEYVDLYDMAQDIIDRLKPAAEKHNISFQIIGQHASVYGTKRILDEMIYNLCDNAVKYNKENGMVYIIINNDNSKVEITVKDTGIGIPPEHSRRVFERFYRVDKSHSKQVGGTGLGLAIVKHAAMYHNAEISLDSTENEGTAITVTFRTDIKQ